jgi:hypothetical protein
VFNPEFANLTAKELWPHFFSALDEIRAAPEDISSTRDPHNWAYMYETYNGSKVIKFHRFKNIVSEVRKSR